MKETTAAQEWFRRGSNVKKKDEVIILNDYRERKRSVIVQCEAELQDLIDGVEFIFNPKGE